MGFQAPECVLQLLYLGRKRSEIVIVVLCLNPSVEKILNLSTKLLFLSNDARCVDVSRIDGLNVLLSQSYTSLCTYLSAEKCRPDMLTQKKVVPRVAAPRA